MAKKAITPDMIADQFFKYLMHNQCHVCWRLLSEPSRKQFMAWTLNDIYQRHPKAAEAAKIGDAEVKLLFENNDASIMKTFWKRFFYSSGANEFFRYGYYETIAHQGKRATVRVKLVYPDGSQNEVDLQMVQELNGWKLAYVESGLPF
ncbi:MAG: hypothetical protein KTR14_04155 [Vampirovibrio sp.]|nr:hypothetical protein [Vampirovibrio sp.]